MINKTSAGALIFYMESSGKPIFLLLKYKNYWGFVKGLIEEGEEYTQTVIREAGEEANLSDIKMIDGFKHEISYNFRLNGETISKNVIFLLGEVSIPQAKEVKISFEHEDFRWVDFAAAMDMVRHKNERDLLVKAHDFLKEHLRHKKAE
jgi:bis(5'-nucleosidyl)-tetraphosphatase